LTHSSFSALTAELRTGHDSIADKSFASLVVSGREPARKKLSVLGFDRLVPTLQVAHQVTIEIDHFHSVNRHGFLVFSRIPQAN
jgi:hypothetical protein